MHAILSYSWLCYNHHHHHHHQSLVQVIAIWHQVITDTSVNLWSAGVVFQNQRQNLLCSTAHCEDTGPQGWGMLSGGGGQGGGGGWWVWEGVGGGPGGGGAQKHLHGLLLEIQELLKCHCCIKIISFNVWVRYFVWNFKGTLWNSTQKNLTHTLKDVHFICRWT